MDRRMCVKSLLVSGVCCSVIPSFGMNTRALPSTSGPLQDEPDNEITRLKREKEFIINWVHDLLDTMDKELDEATRVKLIEGCGRGCYNRFKFKQDIAQKGKGDIDKLIEAYSQNFEIWKEGEFVHLRYGKVSKQCYCPAGQIRPAQPNDLHCECTRTTHQTVFETALGHPVKVDILETLRRGGKTCHFQIKY